MKKNLKIMTIGIFAILLLITLTACVEGLKVKGKEESESQDSVYFALAGPTEVLEGMGFQDGMNLALSEINQAGILDGKTMIIEEYNDNDELTLGVKTSQEIVAAGKYSGIIGHFTSNIGVATKDIYNDGKVLVMSPVITTVEFTKSSMPYIFRNIVSDEVEAGLILNYAKEQGYKKLAVVYRDNEYGRGISTLINQKCGDYGITVIDSHSDFINVGQFDTQYEKWKALGVDAVFVGDTMPKAKEFIDYIRGESLTIPILGNSGFGFGDIPTEVGIQYATRITYMDFYHGDKGNEKYKAFEKAFVQTYGKEPQYMSVVAYDTVKLLAKATDMAGTKDPKAIAAVLKSAELWETTTGSFHFDENGSAVDMVPTIATVKNGVYTYR